MGIDITRKEKRFQILHVQSINMVLLWVMINYSQKIYFVTAI
jgi:hypothetical protein